MSEESMSGHLITTVDRAGPPPGYLYGTVCRIDFWARMTSALGITQIVIAGSCIVFYLMILMTNIPAYIPTAVGLLIGCVIMAAGILGTIASKKKSRLMVCGFLIVSLFSAIAAMFPLIIGIIQAANQHNTNLLMPICELVFGTVEMVVATWSLGVCCQAICCPNITFGQVTPRFPASSLGVTHFMLSGDGHHVVMVAASPFPYSYTVPAENVPFVLQNGLTSLPLVPCPRVSGAIVTNSPDKATQTGIDEDEKAALLQ